MKINGKKIVALVSAATLMSSVTAFASWEFSGYDTTTPDSYNKIYNEVIDGKYTSKTKLEAVDPKDVSWKFEGYELSYPHAGYERLYLEGNAQKGITRTVAQFPQWDTRFKDFMWEVSGDHRIYQRQQTKINNKYWQWDFGKDAAADEMVFVPTTRFADTTTEFKQYGIANLDNNGNYIFDVAGNVYNQEKYTVCSDFNAIPQAFNVKLDENGVPTKDIAEGDFFHYENLSRINESDGSYAVSDWEIAQNIDIIASKFVSGPSYYGESGVKDVAKMYYNVYNPSWIWDSDTVRLEKSAAIDWTKPVYEMAEPHNYYQYLIVNGLVMDGRNDTPKIWRYTNGKASPSVEWRYAFVEAEYPYNVVEYKFIRNNDGKMIQAYENGQPVFRYPTGEFGNYHIKVTDTEIQVWVKDAKGDYKIDSISRVNADFGSGYAGYTNAAGFVAD